MNIFVLDKNPVLCARYHCDKHVVKMCTEYAQIMSTNARFVGAKDQRLYKVVSPNRKCVKWVRESPANLDWFSFMVATLYDEYTKRFKKKHKSQEIFLSALALYMSYSSISIDDIYNSEQTPFVFDNNVEWEPSGDAIQDYRKLYLTDKLHICKWKTGIPHWFLQYFYDNPDKFTEAAKLLA